MVQRALRLFALVSLSACSDSAFGPEDLLREIDPVVLAGAEIEIVSGDDQEGVVGEALPVPLVAVVTDASGAPLSLAPVTWTFGNGRGSRGKAPARSEFQTMTDARGMTSVVWEIGTAAGVQFASVAIDLPETQPSAPVDGLAPPAGRGKKSDFKATGKPAKPHEIVVSQTSLEIDEGETVTLTAQVVDRHGNVIPDIEIEWASSDSSVVTVESGSAPAPAPIRVAEARPSGPGPKVSLPHLRRPVTVPPRPALDGSQLRIEAPRTLVGVDGF